MANELDWLRSKAKQYDTEIMVINADDAARVECEAGTYRVERFSFEGFVPFRMARALRGAPLVKTDAENEVLHLGTGYRGGEGKVRYYRSTYMRVAA